MTFLRCSGDSFMSKTSKNSLKEKQKTKPKQNFSTYLIHCWFFTQIFLGDEHLLVGKEISGSALKKNTHSARSWTEKCELWRSSGSLYLIQFKKKVTAALSFPFFCDLFFNTCKRNNFLSLSMPFQEQSQKNHWLHGYICMIFL